MRITIGTQATHRASASGLDLTSLPPEVWKIMHQLNWREVAITRVRNGVEYLSMKRWTWLDGFFKNKKPHSVQTSSVSNNPLMLAVRDGPNFRADDQSVESVCRSLGLSSGMAVHLGFATKAPFSLLMLYAEERALCKGEDPEKIAHGIDGLFLDEGWNSFLAQVSRTDRRANAPTPIAA